MGGEPGSDVGASAERLEQRADLLADVGPPGALEQQRPGGALAGGGAQGGEDVGGEGHGAGLVLGSPFAGDPQDRLALVVVDRFELQLADLADPQAVQTEQQGDRQGVGGVDGRGGDEALELRLGQRRGSLRA